MSEAAFFYIESNFACAIVLLLILIHVLRDADRQQSQVLYSRALLSQVVFFGVIDNVWMLVDSGAWPRTAFALRFTNLMIYLGYSCMAILWFIYTEYMLKRKYIQTANGQILAAIPGLIGCAIVTLAFFIKKGYYLEESGSVVNGLVFYIMIMIPFGYLIIASLRSMFLAFSKEGYVDSSLYISVGSYAIPIVISGGIQLTTWRRNFLCYGVMVAMIYVYITYLESKIYMDPLTQINNRNNLNHYLNRSLKNISRSEKLYVLMLDIDRFKDINDMYGHQAGDNALIKLANVLRSVCNDSLRHFVARYGGDEFIIVASVDSENDIKNIIDSIRSKLSELCETEKISYKLDVSIGFALWDPDHMDSIQHLISAADDALYENKNKRKQKARRR